MNAFAAGRRIWFFAAAGSLALGCSPAAAVSCPNDDPPCPTPSPTYQTDVGPLFATYCSRCHAADGGMPAVLLQSYEDVTSTKGGQLTHVFTQIKACKMPQPGEPQPTAAERTTILSWFACCAANGGTCAR
ncbi:MAG TPA: hypothetical protein VHU40_07355 [Polyangia bacterium]|nr:hypothetical protein [Polyangia bacterium]